MMIGEWLQLTVDLIVLCGVFLLVSYFVFGGRFHINMRDGRLKMYLMVKGPKRVYKHHESKGTYNTDEN